MSRLAFELENGGMSSLHVLVIGGGALALLGARPQEERRQLWRLRKRSRPTSRLQGYRVHISPSGSKALHACLAEHLYDAFVDSCGRSVAE